MVNQQQLTSIVNMNFCNEVIEFYKIFKNADKDKNGRLDINEFTKIFREQKKKNLAKGTLISINSDKNEKIDIYEFLSFLLETPKPFTGKGEEEDNKDYIERIKERNEEYSEYIKFSLHLQRHRSIYIRKLELSKKENDKFDNFDYFKTVFSKSNITNDYLKQPSAQKPAPRVARPTSSTSRARQRRQTQAPTSSTSRSRQGQQHQQRQRQQRQRQQQQRLASPTSQKLNIHHTKLSKLKFNHENTPRKKQRQNNKKLYNEIIIKLQKLLRISNYQKEMKYLDINKIKSINIDGKLKELKEISDSIDTIIIPNINYLELKNKSEKLKNSTNTNTENGDIKVFLILEFFLKKYTELNNLFSEYLIESLLINSMFNINKINSSNNTFELPELQLLLDELIDLKKKKVVEYKKKINRIL